MNDAYDELDEVCKDGESVHVKMLVMDSVQRRIAQNHYQPRQAELTDEVRELRATTRAKYLAGLRDAWKSPGVTVTARERLDSGGSNTSDVDDPMQQRSAARDAYVRRLRDAWKAQPRDQAPPDDDPDEDDPSEPANAVEEQLERWQGRDPVDLARAVERRRRATHAEFSQRVSNAWRAK
jgi:hypothetical protein